MNLPHSQSHLDRRAALRGVAAAALCAMPMSWAQQSSSDRWRLLVNEAVTAELSISMLALRYRGWADYNRADLLQGISSVTGLITASAAVRGR